MWKFRGFLALLATAILIGHSPTASAGTAFTDDKLGDAAVPYDIVRAEFSNTTDKLIVRVEFDALGRSDIEVLASTFTDAMKPAHAKFFIVSRREKGRALKPQLFVVSPGTSDRIRCGAMRASFRPAANLVKISVPTICFGEGYGDQHVQVSASLIMGEPADRTKRTEVTLD